MVFLDFSNFLCRMNIERKGFGFISLKLKKNCFAKNAFIFAVTMNNMFNSCHNIIRIVKGAHRGIRDSRNRLAYIIIIRKHLKCSLNEQFDSCHKF